jgi:AcrR family transcriptional regulator
MDAKALSISSGKSGKRAETPTHAATGSTPERIAEAAYDLLRTGGVSAFSLRAVAKRANVRLASVQYHFPSLSALAQAIIHLNRRKYFEAYERAAASAETPRDRLTAVIRFNLQDIQSSETRRFFVHFWSLLESIDGYSGDLLAALYAPQFEMLAAHITDLHPELPRSETAIRAQLIGALIEGMFITLPPVGGGAATQRQALDLCLSIADGTY